MFIERKIYNTLKSHLTVKQITVITGMRRTGKTTLVRRLLDDCNSPNKLYLDLERMDIRLLFQESNYENIIYSLTQRGLKFNEKVYLAIDEIQLLPGIISVIKYLYDHYSIKFIVTGSSSYYLKNQFTESLSGRKRIFELFPLDFNEFLVFKGIPFRPEKIGTPFSLPEYERLKGLYEEYIRYGGFPEIVLSSSSTEKLDLLNDLINSYINIDIKTLSDFRNLASVYSLTKMLATRCSTRLDISKISALTGISRPTVTNYIELFENTYLIYLVPVYTKNIDRELVKAKKIYFCDTGLLSTLASPGSGIIFENAIYLQLRQLGNVNYYALKTGREIDFILNQSIAFEAKETPMIQDFISLSRLCSTIDIREKYIIGHFPPPKSFDGFIWGGNVK